ncbi:eukaryotic mitochondrial regulator protein-domain-containing protein [Podospora didyma]|uniref:Eukaryotic mitochondrial regulator protein-domain-containing protein n=1 Tax=Podospora didyma TaxID=330526 RepID=A0AAE0N6K4_9PEZI|nr:eukaryotic mitochondrial regulator protein-domain-containing protein [Podospora didyma]
MPPRIHSSGCPPLLLNCVPESISSSCSSSLAVRSSSRPLAWMTAQTQSPRCANNFSTTAPRGLNKVQRKMREWIKGPGQQFAEPTGEGKPNYLMGSTDRPFPINPLFKSQPVLSDGAREKIYSAVMERGMPLKAVSARYSVDMRRVAAVVRMKEVERQWEASGKPFAKPYAKAIQGMLPIQHLGPDEPAFEPINDIHVHSYTMQQVFQPAAESKHFTRVDAAKAFGEHILPADEKMRIPELIQLERDLELGIEPADANKKFLEATRESEKAFAATKEAQLQREEDRKTRVESGRFEFRFERINAGAVGHDGRARGAVGWRYGVPFNDRKRGVVKIPTKVE